MIAAVLSGLTLVLFFLNASVGGTVPFLLTVVAASSTFGYCAARVIRSGRWDR